MKYFNRCCRLLGQFFFVLGFNLVFSCKALFCLVLIYIFPMYQIHRQICLILICFMYVFSKIRKVWILNCVLQFTAKVQSLFFTLFSYRKNSHFTKRNKSWLKQSFITHVTTVFPLMGNFWSLKAITFSTIYFINNRTPFYLWNKSRLWKIIHDPWFSCLWKSFLKTFMLPYKINKSYII